MEVIDSKSISPVLKKKRKDAYGNYISKDTNKQYKVSFVDMLQKAGPSETMEPRTLVEFIEVLSYKQYNVIEDNTILSNNNNNLIEDDQDYSSNAAGSCTII